MNRTARYYQYLLGVGVAGLLLAALGGCSASNSPDRQAERSGFDAAEDRKPTEQTLYAMARILMDQGRYAEAEVTLNDVIGGQPQMIAAYASLGFVELRLGKPSDALAAYRQAMAISPGDPVLLNNAGMCCVVSRDYATALPLFQQAVAADWQTPRYRANLAMALAMNGQYDEALRLYGDLMSAGDAHHNLAVLCTLRGDPERAKLELAAERALAAPQPLPTSQPAPLADPQTAARDAHSGAPGMP